MPLERNEKNYVLYRQIYSQLAEVVVEYIHEPSSQAEGLHQKLSEKNPELFQKGFEQLKRVFEAFGMAVSNEGESAKAALMRLASDPAQGGAPQYDEVYAIVSFCLEGHGGIPSRPTTTAPDYYCQGPVLPGFDRAVPTIKHILEQENSGQCIKDFLQERHTGQLVEVDVKMPRPGTDGFVPRLVQKIEQHPAMYFAVNGFWNPDEPIPLRYSHRVIFFYPLYADWFENVLEGIIQ